jgi:hypothetical protein
MLKFQVLALTASLMLGQAAYAGGNSSQSNQNTGYTSGPAAGGNVMPVPNTAGHGRAGEAGLPGSKSGPATSPPKGSKSAKRVQSQQKSHK